ncbi:MAG: glycosyltransferase family 2 protein [Candidatus Gracilibacteria bacterium]|jgi:GT2 family glycosyltransferase|nr:glycosyltransferase family 2 protein [Candidatus Gracilibacteria bacterium]
MKLSIIILNYKTGDFSQRCLKMLKKFPPDCEHEIILVDNASNDGSIEKLEQNWKDVIFVKSNKNLGYGQGNELGIKKAKGKYIAILNPDIEIRKETLNTLVKFMDKHPKAGIVGPRLIYPNGKTQDSFRRFPRIFDLIAKRIKPLRKIFSARLRHYLMWNVDFRRPIKADWVVGAFFVARKKAWDKIEGFDKNYFLFFEDTDICRSMWENSYEVYYNPLTDALHNQKRLSETNSMMDIFKKPTVKIHIKSAYYYFKKWGVKYKTYFKED